MKRNFCELHDCIHSVEDCSANKKENLEKMRKQFNSFDINNDNQIDKKELKILVTDVFKSQKNISKLKFKEEISIDNSARRILTKN